MDETPASRERVAKKTENRLSLLSSESRQNKFLLNVSRLTLSRGNKVFFPWNRTWMQNAKFCEQVWQRTFPEIHSAETSVGKIEEIESNDRFFASQRKIRLLLSTISLLICEPSPFELSRQKFLQEDSIRYKKFQIFKRNSKYLRILNNFTT